jgi:hypothetical protein
MSAPGYHAPSLRVSGILVMLEMIGGVVIFIFGLASIAGAG